MPIPNAEAMIYNHYIMLLQLLEIGIPYDEIYQMDEQEVNYILAINAAIADKRNEGH